MSGEWQGLSSAVRAAAREEATKVSPPPVRSVVVSVTPLVLDAIDDDLVLEEGEADFVISQQLLDTRNRGGLIVGDVIIVQRVAAEWHALTGVTDTPPLPFPGADLQGRHAGMHAIGGSDPVTPGSIGAASAALSPTADEKAALPGTHGSPGSANRYLTNSDLRNTNSRTPTSHAGSHASGGSDPITPASIGAASAGGAPAAHAASHAVGGTDPVTPAAIGASAASHLHDDRYVIGTGRLIAYGRNMTFTNSVLSNLVTIDTPFGSSDSVATGKSSDIGVSTDDQADGNVTIRAWSRTNLVLDGVYPVVVFVLGV